MVMDAKQEKTQISRLEKLINESEAGRKTLIIAIISF